MTTTTERIAAAIKGILEEDRRESRERIAELERDAAHFASHREHIEYLGAQVEDRRLQAVDLIKDINSLRATIDDLNRQLDEAHKENARLVMENARLVDSLAIEAKRG